METDTLSILVLTHSSNVKLWHSTFDLIYKFLKNIKVNVMTNDKELFLKTVKYDNINIIYEYDENSETYFMRHSSLMKLIQDKYVINFVDNSWITNANESLLLNLLKTMETYTIDRLALYSDQLFNGTNRVIKPIIDMDETNFITESTEYFNFSASPGIWKRESLIEVCDTFRNLTYRQTESKPVQDFVTAHYNIYHLHSTVDKMMSWNCKLVSYFEFAHLYGGSRWHPDPDAAYNNLKDTVFNLIKEYNIEYSIEPELTYDKWNHN